MHVIRGDGTVDGGRRSGCVIASDGGDSMTHRKTRSSDEYWFTLRSELRLHRAALDVAHASYLYLVSWSQSLVLLIHYISSIIRAANVERGWLGLYAFRHVLPEHTPTRFLLMCCQIYASRAWFAAGYHASNIKGCTNVSAVSMSLVGAQSVHGCDVTPMH